MKMMTLLDWPVEHEFVDLLAYSLHFLHFPVACKSLRIFYAVSKKRVETVKALLEGGANLEVPW